MIVDFQHGIPFFSPLWARDKPVVGVVHQVHQAQFDLHFPQPLNLAARMLERRISRRVYRGRSLVAVSPLTLAEMRRHLGIRQQIYLVPNGIAPLPPSDRATATGYRKWAQCFSWDASAERLARVVLSEMGRAARGARSGGGPVSWPPWHGGRQRRVARSPTSCGKHCG